MKKRNIFLIIATVLIIVSFSFIALVAYAAKSVFGCPLYFFNHEETIKITQDDFEIQVPETATNLCLSATGGMDYAYCYFSLTLSGEEECKQFIKTLDVSMADFQRISELPEEYKLIPHIWYCEGYRTFKKRWGITGYDDYYIYTDKKVGKLKVVYIPKHNRIFVIKRVPS